MINQILQLVDNFKVKELLKLIEDYPLLRNNSEIQSDRKRIEKLCQKIQNQVDTIQSNCIHKFKKNYEYPGRFLGDEKGAVLSKDCTECGLHLDKPKVKSGDICERCWSTEMEYLGQIPGQGEHPSVYKCKDCKHETVIH